MHLFDFPPLYIFKCVLKCFVPEEATSHCLHFIVEKCQRNATNVTMPLPIQAICGYIWKRTMEKSQTNATSVITHHQSQSIWGLIWKRTVENSQTNETRVTLHSPRILKCLNICIICTYKKEIHIIKITHLFSKPNWIWFVLVWRQKRVNAKYWR